MGEYERLVKHSNQEFQKLPTNLTILKNHILSNTSQTYELNITKKAKLMIYKYLKCFNKNIFFEIGHKQDITQYISVFDILDLDSKLGIEIKYQKVNHIEIRNKLKEEEKILNKSIVIFIQKYKFGTRKPRPTYQFNTETVWAYKQEDLNYFILNVDNPDLSFLDQFLKK